MVDGYNLSLPGGGPKGAFQAGALSYLESQQINPSSIVGSSIVRLMLVIFLQITLLVELKATGKDLSLILKVFLILKKCGKKRNSVAQEDY